MCVKYRLHNESYRTNSAVQSVFVQQKTINMLFCVFTHKGTKAMRYLIAALLIVYATQAYPRGHSSGDSSSYSRADKLKSDTKDHYGTDDRKK